MCYIFYKTERQALMKRKRVKKKSQTSRDIRSTREWYD